MPATIIERDVLAPGTGAIVVSARDHAAVVTRASAASPLRLLTPKNRGNAAWIFTSSYGGGLVDGDALDLSVDVQPAATAMLSTQSSTKVYRSERGTTSTLDATVGDDGTLVSLPDPIVPFAGARYTQVQRFALRPGASLVALDWMTSGRLARGERWQFDRYRSTTSVSVGGRLVSFDAVRLQQEDGDLAMRMGRFDVLAVLVLFGARVSAPARELVAAIAGIPVVRRPETIVTAAPIGEAGCIVRLAGMDLQDVRRRVRETLDFVPSLLGDNPWARKW